jgi:aminopeptidase N
MAGKTLSTALPDCTSIVKADSGDAGYYRVSYDPALFARLQKNLAQFPSADQLGLLDDSWALVEAGRDPVTNYFALVESLRHEKTAALWDQIMGTLIFIDSLERKQPGHAAFQQYACALLRPQLQRLGWKDRFSDNPPDSLLRTHIIEMLGHFGDSAVIAEAKARFETFIAVPESLPADLRPAVLQTVGRYSDRKIYDEIHRLARDAQGTEERQLYYQALASSLDPALARQTLALSLTDESVPEETTALVIHVATSGEHPELAWSFAREHIKDLLAKVDSFDRNNYVPSILASFSDAALADELESYVKENIAEGAFARAKQTAENIRFKSALKKRDLAMIDAWVAARIRTTASGN